MVNRQAQPLWRDAVPPGKAASFSLGVIHPRHFRGRSLRNISIRLSSSSPISTRTTAWGEVCGSSRWYARSSHAPKSDRVLRRKRQFPQLTRSPRVVQTLYRCRASGSAVHSGAVARTTHRAPQSPQRLLWTVTPATNTSEGGLPY